MTLSLLCTISQPACDSSLCVTAVCDVIRVCCLPSPLDAIYSFRCTMRARFESRDHPGVKILWSHNFDFSRVLPICILNTTITSTSCISPWIRCTRKQFVSRCRPKTTLLTDRVRTLLTHSNPIRSNPTLHIIFSARQSGGARTKNKNQTKLKSGRLPKSLSRGVHSQKGCVYMSPPHQPDQHLHFFSWRAITVVPMYRSTPLPFLSESQAARRLSTNPGCWLRKRLTPVMRTSAVHLRPKPNTPLRQVTETTLENLPTHLRTLQYREGRAPPKN